MAIERTRMLLRGLTRSAKNETVANSKPAAAAKKGCRRRSLTRKLAAGEKSCLRPAAKVADGNNVSPSAATVPVTHTRSATGRVDQNGHGTSFHFNSNRLPVANHAVAARAAIKSNVLVRC